MQCVFLCCQSILHKNTFFRCSFCGYGNWMQEPCCTIKIMMMALFFFTSMVLIVLIIINFLFNTNTSWMLCNTLIFLSFGCATQSSDLFWFDGRLKRKEMWIRMSVIKEFLDIVHLTYVIKKKTYKKEN